MLATVFRLEAVYKIFLEDAENAFPRNHHYRTFWHSWSLFWCCRIPTRRPAAL